MKESQPSKLRNLTADAVIALAGIGFLVVAVVIFTQGVYSTPDASTTEITAAAKHETWQMFSGKVTRVIDGDTVKIFDGTKDINVRLIGIDAPEVSPHGGQPFGEAAKGYLDAMIDGKTVQVHWKNIDLYGRTDGQIILDGKDVCRAMVSAGLAWSYTKYSRAYADDEALARKGRHGLWSDPSPVAPWDWRKENRK